MNNAQGLDELNITLGQIVQRIQSPMPAYREIATMQASSVQENFRQGGRPDRWLESRRAKKEGGQTLLKTGRLMRSESQPQVSNDGIVFGSNLPYAAIHQYGGEINIGARSELFTQNRFVRGDKKGRFKKGTKAGRGFTTKYTTIDEYSYSIKMPARPSIVFQPEENALAGQILLRHILGRN